MATSKRELKKLIQYACGDIAGECIRAQQTIPGTDVEKWDNIVLNVALLQQEAVNRVSVDFDKTPKDFASKKEYNKARRAYFKQVEKGINDYMQAEVEKIVKEMNALLPKKAE